MKKLSEVEKETLLIRVLSQGRGSVEYARDLLTGANDPESEPPEPENGPFHLISTPPRWKRFSEGVLERHF